MTSLRSLIGFLAVSLLITGCRKDYSDEDGKIPGVIDASWEFKESGQLYNGNMDSAYVQSAGGFTTLSMIGSGLSNQTSEIIFQVVGSNLGTGSYSSPNIFFQYSENGNILFQTFPGQSGEFTINITEIDSLSVTGTFSGTVHDTQGNTHTITDGNFSVPLSDFIPPPQQNGQLTVWATEICFDGGSIEIKINEQTGFISDAFIVEPDCGGQGAATFSLPYGLYTVTAICSDDTISYDVNVNSPCVKLKVDFVNPPLLQDYLPLTLGSYWDYNDLSNPATTHRATSVSDTVIDGRLYVMVTNTLPDTFYYRKEPNVYYEYRTLDFNQFVVNAPSVEMVILHDDYQEGQTWESAPIDIVLSGIAVKVKLVSTIARRDFSQVINGTQYDNLIEVQTEIYFSADGGSTYQSSGSSYITVFANGKGIVYYYDVERDIEWGVTGLVINP